MSARDAPVLEPVHVAVRAVGHRLQVTFLDRHGLPVMRALLSVDQWLDLCSQGAGAAREALRLDEVPG